MTKAILKQDYDGFKKGQHVNIVGFFACSDGTRAVITTSESFTAIPMRDLKPDSDDEGLFYPSSGGRKIEYEIEERNL